MSFIIIFSYIAVGYFEVNYLLKRNEKKQVLLYIFLMSLALIVSGLLSIGVEIPSPAIFLEKIVTMVIS